MFTKIVLTLYYIYLFNSTFIKFLLGWEPEMILNYPEVNTESGTEKILNNFLIERVTGILFSISNYDKGLIGTFRYKAGCQWV